MTKNRRDIQIYWNWPALFVVQMPPHSDTRKYADIFCLWCPSNTVSVDCMQRNFNRPQHSPSLGTGQTGYLCRFWEIFHTLIFLKKRPSHPYSHPPKTALHWVRDRSKFIGYLGRYAFWEKMSLKKVFAPLIFSEKKSSTPFLFLPKTALI